MFCASFFFCFGRVGGLGLGLRAGAVAGFRLGLGAGGCAKHTLWSSLLGLSAV